MDHIKIISETINFVPYNYEYTFSAPQTDRLLIQDLLISIHGAPAFTHPGGRVGVSCNDVRFYLDGRDLTPFLTKNLQKKLEQVDQAILKDEYTFALNKWLELEEKMGLAYGTTDLGKEKNIAKSILNTNPLSKNLNKLGDTLVGFGGNLHIFNFLYKEISIPPVSLFEIIQDYNSTEADEIKPLEIKRLTFSAGPCRLFSNDWDPINIPSGSLYCLFEIKVHDTLEDRVDRLEEQLESMQSEISGVLDDIREGIISTQTDLRKLGSDLRTTSTNVSAIQTELFNHQKQLEAVKNTTQEILKAIETI